MEARGQFGTSPAREPVDQRASPRYPLQVDIRIYARDALVVRGRTVDISESGISAMLWVEVPLNEVVRLEFALPDGEAETLAVVRQKTAFRYGFQFLDAGPVKELIRRTCQQLGMEQAKPDRAIP
jgi:PilZ domain